MHSPEKKQQSRRPAYEHVAIYGASQTGKSTLLRKFSRGSKRAELIYDPTIAPSDWHDGWRPDKRQWYNWDAPPDATAEMTTDRGEFAARAYSVSDRDLFIDEAADIFGQRDHDNYPIMTQGRHRGLRIIYASQRPRHISPTVRDQAAMVYMFRLSLADMQSVLADAGFSIKDLPCNPPRAAGEVVTIDKITGMIYPRFHSTAPTAPE